MLTRWTTLGRRRQQCCTFLHCYTYLELDRRGAVMLGFWSMRWMPTSALIGETPAKIWSLLQTGQHACHVTLCCDMSVLSWLLELHGYAGCRPVSAKCWSSAWNWTARGCHAALFCDMPVLSWLLELHGYAGCRPVSAKCWSSAWNWTARGCHAALFCDMPVLSWLLELHGYAGCRPVSAKCWSSAWNWTARGCHAALFCDMPVLSCL